MDFSYEEIISIHESLNRKYIYKQVTTCLLSCVSLSWLVQSTLVSLVVRDHASTNTPLIVKILAMVCHFYPGLDWNRLGLKGDPSTYTTI